MHLTRTIAIPVVALASLCSSIVSATPVELKVSGFAISDGVYVRSSARGFYGTIPSGGGSQFFLPQFNTSLGTLLSAKVYFDWDMVTARYMHATRLFGGTASIQSRLVVTTQPTISGLSSLGLTGANVQANHDLRSCEDSAFIGTVFCDVEDESGDLGSIVEVFSGDDLRVFEGDGDFRFRVEDIVFGFSEVDGQPTNLSDDIDLLLLQLGVSGTGSAGKAGLVAGVLALGTYFAANANEGHGLIGRFADIHAAAIYGISAEITYTYEPTQSVSEPTSLALVSLGLAGLAWPRLRKRINSR